MKIDARVGYAPTPGVRLIELDGRNLLYIEHRQQIFELNPTAALIWRALSAGGSPSGATGEVSGAASGLGASCGSAAEMVADAAVQWTLDGLLIPEPFEPLLAERPKVGRTLVLDELAVEVRTHGIGCEALDAAFRHLYAPHAGPRRRLAIAAWAGRVLFYLEDALVAVADPDGWLAEAKAVLTQLYVEAVEGAFLTHGALLARGDCTLLLSGAPGAGKSTLALALVAAGWRFGGDDMVRITPSGLAQGVCFPATVKTGAVALLRSACPALGEIPQWRRADGQHARYVPPTNAVRASARPLDVVLILARDASAGAATVRLSPVDALSAIVEGGYARRWRMDGAALCALAHRLERAVCVRLEYSDLGPALAAIDDVARVATEPA